MKIIIYMFVLLNLWSVSYILCSCGQLAHSCDVATARQAAAALLNMASSQEKEMGERGALESLLGNFSITSSLCNVIT